MALAGERRGRREAFSLVGLGFPAEDVDASDARLDDGLVVRESGHDVAGTRGNDLRARGPGKPGREPGRRFERRARFIEIDDVRQSHLCLSAFRLAQME